MHPAFTARVTYAVDFLSTFTSAQLANSKLTHANIAPKTAKQAHRLNHIQHWLRKRGQESRESAVKLTFELG
jgi:hypothetical protein